LSHIPNYRRIAPRATLYRWYCSCGGVATSVHGYTESQNSWRKHDEDVHGKRKGRKISLCDKCGGQCTAITTYNSRMVPKTYMRLGHYCWKCELAHMKEDEK